MEKKKGGDKARGREKGQTFSSSSKCLVEGSLPNDGDCGQKRRKLSLLINKEEKEGEEMRAYTVLGGVDSLAA